MGKRIITNENFDSYKEQVEHFSKQGLTFNEQAERLGISRSTIGNILRADSFADYSLSLRSLRKRYLLRTTQVAEAKKQAREDDRNGKVYTFGKKPSIIVGAPNTEDEYTSLEDKAWRLVLSNPDNRGLRDLARKISLLAKKA